MSSTKHYAPPYCVESVFDDTLAVDICLDYEVPEEGRPVLIACIMGGDGDLRDRHRAEATAKFVVRACNAHAALVELARFVIAEAEYLPHVLAELKAKAEAALGTISPSSETIVGKIGTNGAETGTPDLLAAIEFAFLHTRGIIAIDKQGQDRLTEARDRLNLAMVHAGHDWKPAAARAESGAQQ